MHTTEFKEQNLNSILPPKEAEKEYSMLLKES